VDVFGSRANWAAEAGSTSPFPIPKTRAESPESHVLIVEDNELVTGALRILFEATGRRVTIAHTVAEAVEKGRQDPPDLVLLDLTLPDGDGLEVLESLARNGVSPKATVALTGRDDPESIARCSAAGITAVMVKPVPAKELLRRANDWLA
jgi:DNA-binding response OmpR family regulator